VWQKYFKEEQRSVWLGKNILRAGGKQRFGGTKYTKYNVIK